MAEKTPVRTCFLAFTLLTVIKTCEMKFAQSFLEQDNNLQTVKKEIYFIDNSFNTAVK